MLTEQKLRERSFKQMNNEKFTIQSQLQEKLGVFDI